MSENSNNKNNNRRRRNPNNKGGNRGPKHNKNNNYNNKRNSNRNRRPKSLTPSRILQKYENLMEQHVIARKKYFEVFGRITGKQFQKIENNFNRTLKAIVEYKDSLKDWQQEVLDKKLNFYPKDTQYSQAHQDEQALEVEFEGIFEDPHLLPTQKEHLWSNDTEESVGTIDDYKAYKGITD